MTQEVKKGKKSKWEKDYTLCDPRIQKLVADRFFPKNAVVPIIKYFSPQVSSSSIYNALGGKSVSEQSLLRIIEAIEFMLETRKTRELLGANELIERGKAIEVSVGRV